MSEIYFELASISKNRSTDFRGSTVQLKHLLWVNQLIHVQNSVKNPRHRFNKIRLKQILFDNTTNIL